MRFFIISSALLVLLAQCGYPVAEYPTPPSYPTTPKYPVAYPSASDSEVNTFFESETTAEFRGRAKARTVHNRQFQRRALQPIRRFQQKKQ